MPFDPSAWQLTHYLVVAAAVLLGWALGFGLARRSSQAARVRELERQLEEARDELAGYRDQVAGHFTETSKHLRDLALQYRTVYEHLAEGARTLCPEAAVPIEAGLPSSLLAETAVSNPDEERIPDVEAVTEEVEAEETEIPSPEAGRTTEGGESWEAEEATALASTADRPARPGEASSEAEPGEAEGEPGPEETRTRPA